ncbi:MAG: apolipoprotein N-acyltransferase [Planctomycetales bacterium]|nr:apolipoprotein N-acyltransferase [Planctomycetales bacterium]
MTDQVAESTRSVTPDASVATDEKLSRQRKWLDLLMLEGVAVLLYLAYPPVGWWLLAWLAPIGWIRFATTQTWHLRRPYRRLYFVGLLYSLLLVQWIRLPHWSAYFGWWLLAVYLAVYVPLFVAATRGLMWQLKLPSWLAAPVAWTGLELVRGYLLTGFSMSLLSHTQVKLTPLLQIADLVGAYGVSFVVILVAASLETLLPRGDQQPAPRWRWLAPVISLLTLAGCWMYGQTRIVTLQPTSDPGSRTLNAALIQGSLDTQFDGDEQRVMDAFFDYVALSGKSLMYPPVDVIIWPESMFSANQNMLSYDPPVTGFPGWDGTAEELRQRLDELKGVVKERVDWTTQQLKTPMIVGTGWDHFVAGEVRRYNSCVYLSAQGEVLDRYDKMHPVMFGEYVPFGRWFPWLYYLTPMSGGLAEGQTAHAFRVNDVVLSPCICFENTVPHLLRRQFNQLDAQGDNPDVLVTVTNDGWFWGSSLLDVHLACGVFRAIELHLPTLIAANTGFSASIAATGQIQEQGPRRDRGVLLPRLWLPATPANSVYSRWGDMFAAGCLVTVLVAIGKAGLK